MKNAHSGTAIPIERSVNMKFKEIKLNSRQNCGYNAFENDIVYVKIIDVKNQTGKVMGVHQSNHKPVNNIYICKVSKDQGSLMSPLDKSFPKIHINNGYGRRYYESNIKNRNSNSVKPEQKSVVDRERESAKYADNLYYSLYDLKINKSTNKPNLIFREIVKFNPDTNEYLFIIFYEGWDPHFMYPHGKIVGTLSSRESLKDNFHLISSICNIDSLDITSRYEKEVKNILINHKCFEEQNKFMPSNAIVFTIDNETTKDMDDAISYHKEDSDIIIGVHISDVTKYIFSTSEIYEQAKSRFCTSYPPKFSNIPPIQIFNEKLATDFLSLVPNEPRAVVSVFFRFTQNMLIHDIKLSEIIQPIFSQGVIVSKYKLNYDEVSSWLRQVNVPQNVDEKLFLALTETFKIARKLRRARLPESYFVRSLNKCYKDFKIENRFEANILIEEFMLLANEYVAKKIYEKYPDSSLLRMQDPVKNSENLENLFKLTNMNFAGQLKEYCNLLNVNISDFDSKNKLVVSKRFFDQFSEFMKNDVEEARNLLQYDAYYNEFFVHITEWYRISNPAYYNCSIKDCVNNGHFSLNKPLYTHFTSPIRRFTDVVVHRLLKSIINNIEITDSTLDINEVCEIANKKVKNNKTFEKLCAPYAVFDETEKRHCFILDCVCSEISDEEIFFAHPLLQKASSIRKIKFAHLSLDDIPLSSPINEKIDNCTFKWRKIIFSCPPHLISSSKSSKFPIDNHLYDSYLPCSASKLFREIRRSYLSGENLKDELEKLQSNFKSTDYNNIISSDSFSVVDPIIDIELNIFVKNTMRIQFCKYKVNGLAQISPELYIVTPTFHICLIHQNDPTRFFIPGGKLNLEYNDIKKSFKSISEYQKYFEPLIEIESLEEALGEKCAFTLEKVPIMWIVSESLRAQCKERYGVIKLSNEFCISRNNIFNDDRYKIIDRCEYLITKGVFSVGRSLLCLRYKKENWNNYWVGHGQVVHIDKYRMENTIMKVILFRLTQSDFDSFPKCGETETFTIDIYPKSPISIRQQVIVSSINKYEILEKVILGTQILSSERNNYIISEIENELKGESFLKFNKNQNKAIKNALNHKLSLIWGPPGTGKTQIGCHLSFVYAFQNAKRKKNGVVLYCGPSNDCVNLVASKMREKFKEKCPKLLRIFGEQQELSDFPLPGYFVKNNPLTKEIQEVSLHFLIRKEGEKAMRLKLFDEFFQNILRTKHCLNGENIHDCIVAYKDTIKEAKKEYIEKNQFKMVLCTTSVSATVVMELFNITQVIIDEAGMCKEPETLIPIAATEQSVENVVLIGDHKQLRPIIKSRVAKTHGLQISLFERYQELRPDLVTMLNFQYRMHPSICEFPSNEFYSDELITKVSKLWSGLTPWDMCINVPYRNNADMREKQKIFFKREWNGIDYDKVNRKDYQESLRTSNYNAIPNEKWPGKRKIPYNCFRYPFEWYPERVIFINVIGDEISQSVTTKTGNENSKGNKEEVEAAGYIYEKIIKKCEPPRLAPNFITVLTQYKLQQSLLEKKCKSILTKVKVKIDPIVKTVIRSQGSENDYVIFSTVRSLRDKQDINSHPTPGWEKQYLGFITDLNQINVALTRAKKGLIIIGNKYLLGVNDTWKKLITNFEQRDCVIENYLDFI